MAAAATTAIADAAPAARPIELNCDLAVKAGKEADFIKYFNDVFRPVAKKHEGYIDLKLLKIDQEIRGKTPPNCNFRFSLVYKSEDLRQKWINSADHNKYWPAMEDMLTDHEFSILIYDVY
jgi:hypothetical protein